MHIALIHDPKQRGERRKRDEDIYEIKSLYTRRIEETVARQRIQKVRAYQEWEKGKGGKMLPRSERLERRENRNRTHQNSGQGRKPLELLMLAKRST